MNKILERSKIVIPIFILIFFFSITLAVRMQNTALTSSDDPYFHARISADMVTGDKSYYPSFSTISEKPVDLYILYHALMAPFTFKLVNGDYQGFINGVKIYHSIIDALLFLTFYFVLFKILRISQINRTNLELKFQSILGTILLYSTSIIFLSRILYERPHTLSIIAMLLSFYFIVYKKWFGLFIVVFLLPFFYSASFILIIVPAVYIFLLTKSTLLEKLRPVFITTLGLTIGILTRPDSLAYLYNGYIIPILSIFHNVLPKQIESYTISELGTNKFSLFTDYWMIIFILLWLVVGYIYIKKISKFSSILDKLIFIVSGILFTTIIFVNRAIEYALPFVILFMVYNYNTYASYICKKLNLDKLIFSLTTYSPKIREIFIFTISIIFFVFLYMQNANTILILKKKVWIDSDKYKIASQYLRENIDKERVIYIQNFGVYPKLFFYNPDFHYSSGMDPMFQINYSPKIFRQIKDFENGNESIDTIRNLDIGYFFFDTKLVNSNTKRKFIRIIREDPSLKLIYKKDNIEVYGFK